MPLVKLIKLDNGGLIGIWHQSELLEELEAAYSFTGDEKEAYQVLRLAKRRGEWLALRLCLSSVLASGGHPYKPVWKSPENKPYVPGESYELSFSHCDDYAAVYWHPGIAVGIDIERKDRQVERIAPKFLSDKELELFAGNDLQLLAWSFKETLYKVFSRKQLDFKKHLLLEKRGGHYYGYIQRESGEVHALAYLRYEDCILTFNID
jgi:4'-phosphopantetheinyl transferase EntD